MLSGVLLFFGCTEDLAKDLFGEKTPIIVTANVEDMNMAFTTRTATMDLNSGSFTLSGDDAIDKVLVHIGSADHTYTLNGTGNTTTELTEDKVTYFPKDASSVDVYGHYPCEAGFSTVSDQQYFTIQKDQTTDAGYLKSDLMTADNSPATRTRNGNGTWTVNKTANLDFKHQMAKIIVNVSTVENSGLTITKVEINGVKPRVPVTYDATDGEYTIGAAVNALNDDANADANHRYNLQVLSGPGEATVLIPAQRFNVETEPENLANSRTFITVTATYQGSSKEMRYYFKGNGKMFYANQVYHVYLVLGEKDAQDLHDEYFVDGVELAKWAADDDATSVHVSAAEEKLKLVAETIEIINNATGKVYNGSPITLTVNQDDKIDDSIDELVVISTIGGRQKLVYGDDYSLHYSTNTNAGTAYISIMGLGRYAGSVETSFTIGQKDISDESVTVTVPTETYDGYPHEPTPTLTDSETGKTLTLYDYQTSYSGDRTNAYSTDAKVTITGQGNYKNSRNKIYTIAKAQGAISFDKTNLSFVKPEGRQFDYINNITITGDGTVKSCSSNNSDKVSTDNSGKITVKAAGNATITYTVEGRNYDYTGVNSSYNVSVSQGPRLPIEYVAEHDMYDATHMSTTHQSDGSCTLCWAESEGDGRDALNEVGVPRSTYIKNLTLNGLWDGGIHYHMPADGELTSIFPRGAAISWGYNALAVTDQDVQFGVKAVNKTTNDDDAGYVFAITKADTQDWETDVYADALVPNEIEEKGDGNAYGIRFKGSTYCCAYRWQWIYTSAANQSFTLNTIGKYSVIVRVIYLGPMDSSTYNREKLASLDWDGTHGTDVIIRRFPQNGITYDGYQNPAGFVATSTPTWKWLWSCTPQNASKTYHYSVRLVGSNGLQGHQYHGMDTGSNFSIRLFKDYEH